MGWNSYYNWRPYVSVGERRRQAAKKIAKMKKAGRKVAPVKIAGRRIATTFWGDAWCKNLEAYSDYSNRLPRGRTYVRNGSVIDLQIEAGRVRALVSGSDIYEVNIKIKPLAKQRWNDIKGQCAGHIDSLVELLRGSISRGVMEIVTRKGKGLFPSPREISLSCSCPDWATMCKHVAATLYGAGARLDHEPELLFALRGADPTEMVEAAVDQPQTLRKSRRGRVLKSDELSSVFGVDIDMDEASSKDVSTPAKPAKRARRTAQARKDSTSRTSKKIKRRGSPLPKGPHQRKPPPGRPLPKGPQQRKPPPGRPLPTGPLQRKLRPRGPPLERRVPRRNRLRRKGARELGGDDMRWHPIKGESNHVRAVPVAARK
jgi:uncharacterized Zn finger protein